METNDTISNDTIPSSSLPSQSMNSYNQHKKLYFIIAIAVIVIAAGVIWWQLGKQIDETQVSAPAKIASPETREVTGINNDVNNLEMGNLENEFQQIDKDLNSL